MSEHAKGLSRAHGSAATRPAAQRVQAKLAVSDRQDPMEREADSVADRVTAGQPAPAVSRMAAPEKKPETAARQAQPETKKEPGVQRATAPEKKQEPGVQRAAAPEKKEPKVQRAEAPEKKKEPAVQRAAVPEKKKERAVQRAAVPEKRKPETPVQRQADEREEVQAKSASDSGASMGHVAQQAVDSKGSGRPLDPGVRSRVESSLGADMSHVRVHDDASARASASALGARAFTHGSDIWMGPGESSSDVRLMAHEATHVVQQGGAAQRLVQRTNGTLGTPPAAPPASAAAFTTATGQPDPAANPERIIFDSLPITPFKTRDHRGDAYRAKLPLTRMRNYRRRSVADPRQGDKWRTELSKTQIRSILQDKHERAHPGAEAPGGNYVFETTTRGGPGGTSRFHFGNLDAITEALTIPTWGRGDHPDGHIYQLDHIVELQVANYDAQTWGAGIDNIELLEAETNTNSGGAIDRAITAKINAFLSAARAQLGEETANQQFGGGPPDVKERFALQFNNIVAGTEGPASLRRDMYWRRAEIEAGEHLAAVRASSPAALGRAGHVRVFYRATGGISREFTWSPGDTAVRPSEATILRPFVTNQKTFVTDGEGVETNPSFGTLFINVRPDDKNWQQFSTDVPIPVHRVAGARYAGYVERDSIRAQLYPLRHKKLSPIHVDRFELGDDGIEVDGVIAPELPLLRDAEVNFEIRGSRLAIFKDFTAPELHVPPPFRISSITLRVFADTERGLGLDGRVNFGIERVGQGYLEATASTSGPIGFRGAFDFESTTFDPAHIELSYLDNEFRGSGTIGVPDGKVSGVKSAQVSVSIESRGGVTSITGEGSLEPKVRAIRRGTVHFAHHPERGTEIGGTLELSDDIPNVRSGSVEAMLSRPPDRPEWDLRVHGTVTAGAAGLTANVNVDYHNGLFTVEGQGAYARGMLSGTLTVGATNRALGADGRPTETIGDRIIAYGGGTVTVRIAPWLQGTVGVRFLPNGEIELSGEIALPSQIEIFSRKQIEKSILNIAVQVPIFPGIVAEIGGGLSAEAGIGPGVIDQLRLGITYNPAHEEQTHVTGDAHLNIPADAGLRLSVRAGIGLGITGASATGGLEIGGMLGLAGAAQAGVHVDWMPGTGLRIDAYGDIHAEPIFRFDISGYVSVRALGFEVYGNTWRFASYEFGSNLRFGVRFPIHYVEGQPFDISLSEVEFTVPDVSPRDILSGLIDRIA